MIRRAVLEDVPQLVAMGLEFVTTSEYARHLPANAAAIRQTVGWMLEAPENAAIFVLAVDGVLKGAIGLALSSHLWSGEPYAGELFWWVNPAARGTGGIRLLRYAEQWAEQHGARFIQMIAPNEGVGAIYARLGYAPIETGYQRRFE